MMVEPGLDVLLPHVDSKYTLVAVSSKRARKIMAKDAAELENPVTLALHEIADGKIEWERVENSEAKAAECVACECSEEVAEETANEAVETEELDD